MTVVWYRPITFGLIEMAGTMLSLQPNELTNTNILIRGGLFESQILIHLSINSAFVN